MIELGMKDKIFGAELLKTLTPGKDYIIKKGRRPESFPNLKEDEKVVVGYNQGLGERMIVCDTLEEMQLLYDKYAQGCAVDINFYTGPDPGFISVL